MQRLRTALMIGAIVLLAHASVAQPVVPGAFGFGMATRAAYACGTNPAILRVTTIADSGAGSLRTALTTPGPRLVIFETSGTTVLGTDIDVTEPCLTNRGTDRAVARDHHSQRRSECLRARRADPAHSDSPGRWRAGAATHGSSRRVVDLWGVRIHASRCGVRSCVAELGWR